MECGSRTRNLDEQWRCDQLGGGRGVVCDQTGNIDCLAGNVGFRIQDAPLDNDYS